MASTDARPVPEKNVAYRHYFAIRKTDGSLITSWAGADSEVSKDGGAFTDCTNEATEIGSSGIGYIDITSTEMNADSVILKTTVTNTGALTYVCTFFPEEAGDIRVNSTQIGSSTASAALTTVDGITFESWCELILAELGGKVSKTDNGNGTYTYTYKKQDGTTTKFTKTVSTTDGTRAAGATIS